MTDTDNRYIELSYSSNGRPISYRINLESRPSNLSIGKFWYFICPRTGRLCRTLYQCGKAMRILSLHDDFLSKRHSRTHYRGKIARRYQRILDREDRFNPSGIIRQFERWGFTDWQGVCQRTSRSFSPVPHHANQSLITPCDLSYYQR